MDGRRNPSSDLQAHSELPVPAKKTCKNVNKKTTDQQSYQYLLPSISVSWKPMRPYRYEWLFHAVLSRKKMYQ